MSEIVRQVAGIAITAVNPVAGALFLAASGYISARSAERDARRKAFEDATAGRTVMFRASSPPRQIVYGETMVSGPIAFMGVSGQDNRFLHIVILIAGHQIDSIVQTYLGDTPITNARYNAVYGPRTDISFTTPRVLVSANGPEEPATYTNPPSVRGFMNVPNDGAAVADHAGAILEVEGGANAGLYLVEDVNETSQVKRIDGGVITPEAAGPSITIRRKVVDVYPHLGAPDQVACPELVAAVPEWTTDHRLRGIAYAHVRLAWDAAVFPAGVPNIKFLVRGKNDIYDPRGPATGYRDNSALVIADYIRYQRGLGASQTEVNEAQLITAANICEEAVQIDAGGLLQNRYVSNGSFLLSEKPIDVMEDMVTAMAGTAHWQAGQWRINAGAPIAPSRDINESHLRGPLQWIPRPSKDQTINAVRGIFVDPQNNYQPNDYPPVTNALYETEDGGERLYGTLDLRFVDEVFRSQRLADIALEKARQAITVIWPGKRALITTQLHQVVRVTVTQLGWTNKEFQIVDWTLQPDGGVDLVLREYAASIYTWNFGQATTVDPAPNTSLPDAWSVIQPANLVLQAGTSELYLSGDGTVLSGIRATWERRDAFGTVDIVEYREVGGDTWIEAGRVHNEELFFGPVDDGKQYDVQVRTRTRIGAVSEGTVYSNFAVTGKTQLPSNVVTATFAAQADGTREIPFTTVADLDVIYGGGYRIYHAFGNVNDTAQMLPLHDGLLTNSPYEFNRLAAGQHSFAVVAVDKGGRESAEPAFIFANLPDPRLDGALENIQVNEIGWPGTLTDCIRDEAGKTITARSTLTWDTLPATWDEWTSWAQSPVAQIQYEHPTIDVGVIANFQPLITADTDGNQTIEIQYSDDDTTYTAWATPPAQIDARYIRVRLTVDDAGGTVTPRARSMRILLGAKVIEETIIDVNSATLGGSISARVLPLTKSYSFIRSVQFTLQGVGPRYSVVLLNKATTGPQFVIYNDTVFADALIDATVRGLPAVA